ncbi:hypothetical protein AAG597_16255, partial [Citromicrobium bathyomarinum]
MSEELKMAIVAVRRHGLEPFEKVVAAMPQSLIGPAYARWVRRQARVTAEVCERLRKQGATIDVSQKEVRIVFGGIEARSYLGLLQALVNWRSKAAKQMRAYNRADLNVAVVAPVLGDPV